MENQQSQSSEIALILGLFWLILTINLVFNWTALIPAILWLVYSASAAWYLLKGKEEIRFS
ncbi:MAG: hypothetical protein CVU39_01395 [Chloroflexi bacterium HGW-Chloroflexi-10]|nr:MAG: hypothetical protein CVU39_01395 [Chloroflexi bacterium HGW-Chloroflexi-10]